MFIFEYVGKRESIVDIMIGYGLYKIGKVLQIKSRVFCLILIFRHIREYVVDQLGLQQLLEC